MSLIAILLLFPLIACGLSILATLLHSWQEVWDDGAPIWEYLGLTRSWPLGFFGLVAFGSVQIGLAVAGYAWGDHSALWWLAGIRTADVLWSHWRPWLLDRHPNPGIETSWLYAIEAALIAGVLLS